MFGFLFDFIFYRRAHDLYELEHEHERLLKDITDNRTRLNKTLRS